MVRLDDFRIVIAAQNARGFFDELHQYCYTYAVIGCEYTGHVFQGMCHGFYLIGRQPRCANDHRHTSASSYFRCDNCRVGGRGKCRDYIDIVRHCLDRIHYRYAFGRNAYDFANVFSNYGMTWKLDATTQIQSFGFDGQMRNSLSHPPGNTTNTDLNHNCSQKKLSIRQSFQYRIIVQALCHVCTKR